MWNDISSYSRGQKDRTVESVETNAGWLRICVTRHINYPGSWCLRCAAVQRDLVPLNAKDLEDAKAEALEIVRRQLAEASTALDGIVKQAKETT